MAKGNGVGIEEGDHIQILYPDGSIAEAYVEAVGYDPAAVLMSIVLSDYRPQPEKWTARKDPASGRTLSRAKVRG